VNADALSVTPAAQAALETLRAAAGADGPMERHCLRQFAIAERLAGDREFDRELLLRACWLHDTGLYSDSSDPYVTEGARRSRPGSRGNSRAGVASALTCKSKLMEVRPHGESSPQRAVSPRA
jgi:hypothetical protein